MTNFEKWKDTILAITRNCDQFGAVNGKPCMCTGLNCKECDFHESCITKRYEWLYAEYTAPIIDWSKVPVDTKILVRNWKTDGWYRRYFAGYVDGKIYAWDGGATEWNNNGKLAWKYAKLAEDYNATQF